MTYKGQKWTLAMPPYNLTLEEVSHIAYERSQYYRFERLGRCSVEYYWYPEQVGLIEVIGKTKSASWDEILDCRKDQYLSTKDWDFRRSSKWRFYYDVSGNWLREQVH